MSVEKRISKRTGKTSWRVNYKDMEGCRRAKIFKTKKEAEAYRAKVQVDVSNGLHTPDSISITVSEAAEQWIRLAESRNRELSTIKQYKEHVKLHINPLIGDMKLSKLTKPQIIKFRDDLAVTRSPAMVQKVITSLKGILNCAQERGQVAVNNALGIKSENLARHKKKITPASYAEIKLFKDNASGRWRPLFLTALMTGLRSSELLGLKWDNVDFKKKTIRVEQRADQWGNIGSPKTGTSSRTVGMSNDVVTTLKEWRLQCPHSELNLVFPNGKGKPESHSNMLNRGFYPLMKKCKLGDTAATRKFTFHGLRHAAISMCIDAGWDIKRVQDFAGHASSQVTLDKYGHLFPDPDDSYDRLQAIEEKINAAGGDTTNLRQIR